MPMQVSTHNPGLMSTLRTELAPVPGVDRVLFDEGGAVLVCETQAAAASALKDARDRLEALGLEGLEVTAVVPAAAIARERVRLDSVERIEEADMRVRVRIRLEWLGRTISGEAIGEKGENLELRTTAAATLAALADVADPPLNLRLAGIKPIRAFDAELMVVSLYQPTTVRNLLGAVLVAGDPQRAAALAVLHALNRVMGNFLAT